LSEVGESHAVANSEGVFKIDSPVLEKIPTNLSSKFKCSSNSGGSRDDSWGGKLNLFFDLGFKLIIAREIQYKL